MPKINRYVDISTVEREAKKDYIDRHSPFVTAPAEVKAGEIFQVTVKVGEEYTHPDDFDHYIASVSLFNKETLLATTEFKAGMLGGQGAKGHATVTFNVLAQGKSMSLVAHAYCTKHGIWENEAVAVSVVE
ncbi:MAG: class II SORL domain-containing protein [Deltaproteobacteria bacterium]|nr:class II SORL domain-containing protein [Deltaproteobacteria bacterium]